MVTEAAEKVFELKEQLADNGEIVSFKGFWHSRGIDHSYWILRAPHWSKSINRYVSGWEVTISSSRINGEKVYSESRTFGDWLTAQSVAYSHQYSLVEIERILTERLESC